MSWRDRLDEDERKRVKERDRPDWTAPQLAVKTDDRFSDPDWIYERKFDGERCLVFRGPDDLRLMSRNKKVLNDTYPELEEALATQKARDFIVDGEIVAFDGPVTSFSTLQQRLGISDREEARQSGIDVYFYLFDILYLDGCDVSKLPCRTRKALLRDLLSWDDPLRYTEHRVGDGVGYYNEACRNDWEGVIAKRGSASYKHTRSRDWLKFKCVKGQELVVGGYTDPQGSREVLGALLLGYYDDGTLHYAGKVGTGFKQSDLHRLGKAMKPLQTEDCPFAEDPDERGAHFIKPELVAQIAFTEWTQDGKLRHPRYQGLRDDKDPRDVHREAAS